MIVKFKMFDAVRVVTPPAIFDQSLRAPKIGDIGIVIMIYESPTEGYGVEGVSDDGRRVAWLADFPPDHLEIA